MHWVCCLADYKLGKADTDMTACQKDASHLAREQDIVMVRVQNSTGQGAKERGTNA